MFPPPLEHLQLQSEALHIKTFVSLCVGSFLGFKIKNMQMSFRNEQNFPKEHMNRLVTNSKTDHRISDKTGVMISQFKIWRHQIEKTLQSAAFVILHFCAFSIQIGNYRAYATIQRNEFSKNNQDLRKNPTEATIVVYGYFPGITDLWWVYCRSDDLKFPFLCRFCVLINVFRDYESCSLLLESQHPLSEISTYFW